MQEKNRVKTKKTLLALAEYLKVKGIRGLAEVLEENENKLYGWIKQGNIADTGSILGKYPNISKKWLETGTGSMFRDEPDEPPVVSETLEQWCARIDPQLHSRLKVILNYDAVAHQDVLVELDHAINNLAQKEQVRSLREELEQIKKAG